MYGYIRIFVSLGNITQKLKLYGVRLKWNRDKLRERECCKQNQNI